MKLFHFLSFFSVSLTLGAQNAVISTENPMHDYGEMENVYKLQSDFVIRNEGSRNLFLLRADANTEVKIWTSKKSIAPGDTGMVQVYFYPSKPGKFKEKINLVTNAGSTPFELTIKGEVKSIKKDDKTACYYFKKPANSTVAASQVFVPATPANKNDSIISRQSGWGLDTGSISDDFANIKTPPANPNTNTASKIVKSNEQNSLLGKEHKPNNIIFLIDVSGSMIDSTKLRWMKLAMQKLVDNLRDNDHITLVTYRDSVICNAEALTGRDKDSLKYIISSLKAKGLTRGNRAIHFALDLAVKNYIDGGNNEVILATDGKFTFREQDYIKWNATFGTKEIILSTIAFGFDKEAMKNLKDISEKGKGNFIHIKNRSQAQSALFDEIEKRSRK